MTDLPTTNPRPAPPVTSVKVAAPAPTHYTIDGRPRIGWPDTFVYRWTAETGALKETVLPPPLYAVPKRMPSGIDAQRAPFEIIVRNVDLYDALRRDCGHLLDSPEHWGGDRIGITIDNRK